MRFVVKEQMRWYNCFMDILQKLKLILLNSNDFWLKIEEEKGLKKVLKYLLFISSWGIVITYSAGYYSNEKVRSEPTNFLVGILGYYGLFFILSFLTASMMHLSLKIFKGQASFDKTYQVFIYALTPQILFGFVPVVNLFSSFYAFYLGLLGFSKIHKIGFWKVFFAGTISSIFLFISLFLLGFTLVSTSPVLKEMMNDYISLKKDRLNEDISQGLQENTILPQASSDEYSFIDPGNNFKIKIPEGWSYSYNPDAIEEQEIRISTINHEADDFGVLVIKLTPDKGRTLDDIFRELDRFQLENEDLSSGISFAGQQALLLRYEKQGFSEGSLHKIILIDTFYKGKHYTLDGSFGLNQLNSDKNMKDLYSIIEGFEFLE